MSTRRAIAFALLALQLAGCATWRPIPNDPARMIREERPATVRVWRSDGTRTVVQRPVIENDSIAVVSGACVRLPGRDARYHCPTRGLVALGDVAMLEVSVPDRRPMAILAVGALSVLALGLLYCGAADGYDC